MTICTTVATILPKLNQFQRKAPGLVFFVTNGVLLFITPGTVYLVSHVLGQSTWYHRYRDCVLVSHVLEQWTWYRRVSQTSPDDSCSLIYACIGTVYLVLFLVLIILGQCTYLISHVSKQFNWYRMFWDSVPYLVSQRVPDQPRWQLQPDSTHVLR